jgi:hypothetical protein
VADQPSRLAVASSQPERVPPHHHYCPRHREGYACPKTTARCFLPFKTTAECPREASDEAAAVARGKRFWAPLHERAGG